MFTEKKIYPTYTSKIIMLILPPRLYFIRLISLGCV